MTGTPFLIYSASPVTMDMFSRAAGRIGATIIPELTFPSAVAVARAEVDLANGRSGRIDISLMKEPGRELYPDDQESRAIQAIVGCSPAAEIMVEIDPTTDILDLVALDYFLALADEIGETDSIAVLGTEGFQHLWTVPELRALKARGGRLAPWLEPVAGPRPGCR